jgi:hypothetical protein
LQRAICGAWIAKFYYRPCVIMFAFISFPT